MTGILYYLPGDRAALTEEAYANVLREFGLAHLKGTKTASRRVEQNGPDGGRGLIFVPYVTTPPERIGYYPHEQTWSRCGNYWMGVFKESPVTPSGLQRKNVPIQRIWNVTLADEQEWAVPLARWPYPCETIGESLLPKRRTLDENGNEVKRIADQYAALDTLAYWFYEQYLRILDGDITEIDQDRVVDLAVDALCCMYHVSRKEIMLLGLLTDELARDVAEAATGITAVERMHAATIDAEKKTDEL